MFILVFRPHQRAAWAERYDSENDFVSDFVGGFFARSCNASGKRRRELRKKMDANPDYRTPDDSPAVSPDCSDSINLIVIEMWNGETLVARWKSRGKACDGSGTTFLHQQFKTTADGRRIVHVSEVTTMSDERIKQLLEIPGVWLAKGDEPDAR